MRKEAVVFVSFPGPFPKVQRLSFILNIFSKHPKISLAPYLLSAAWTWVWLRGWVAAPSPPNYNHENHATAFSYTCPGTIKLASFVTYKTVKVVVSMKYPPQKKLHSAMSEVLKLKNIHTL